MQLKFPEYLEYLVLHVRRLLEYFLMEMNIICILL